MDAIQDCRYTSYPLTTAWLFGVARYLAVTNAEDTMKENVTHSRNLFFKKSTLSRLAPWRLIRISPLAGRRATVVSLVALTPPQLSITPTNKSLQRKALMENASAPSRRPTRTGPALGGSEGGPCFLTLYFRPQSAPEELQLLLKLWLRRESTTMVGISFPIHTRIMEAFRDSLGCKLIFISAGEV